MRFERAENSKPTRFRISVVGRLYARAATVRHETANRNENVFDTRNPLDGKINRQRRLRSDGRTIYDRRRRRRRRRGSGP